MTKELVERLREAAIEIDNDGTPSQVGLTSDECRSIADALEAKDARIAELEAALDEAHGFLTTHISKRRNEGDAYYAETRRKIAEARRAASARGREDQQ